MPSLLDHLNPEQREAASHLGGPLLIIAGAGSGKTRTLTHRIAWLIGEQGVGPHEILAVTFTNKAAAEMKERAERLLAGNVRGLWIGTFHSLCARLLRQHADKLGLQSNFVIFDDDDRNTVIKRVLQALDIDPQRHPVKDINYQLSDWKNDLLGPDEAADQLRGHPWTPKVKVVDIYRERSCRTRLSCRSASRSAGSTWISPSTP